MKVKQKNICIILKFSLFLMFLLVLSGCSFQQQKNEKTPIPEYEPTKNDTVNTSHQLPSITGNSSVQDKSYEQVLKDAKSFNIKDMDSLYRNYNTMYRLNLRTDRPTFVVLDDNMPQVEIEAIEDTVAYYNGILATINPRYKLEITYNRKNIKINDTTIFVHNVPLFGLAAGRHTPTSVKFESPTNAYIISAQVWIDLRNEKSINYDYIYKIMIHEFAHALGIRDVYYDGIIKNIDILDMNTMMHPKIKYDTNLYPNDYAVLMAFYSDEYKKHSNYEDAKKVVNKKIEYYTYEFYQEQADYIKQTEHKDWSTINITPENIQQALNLHNSIVKIESDNNSSCTLTVYDKDKNIVEQSTGDVLLINGVLFVNNITLNKPMHYNGVYKEATTPLQLAFHISMCIDNEGETRSIFKDNFGKTITNFEKN